MGMIQYQKYTTISDDEKIHSHKKTALAVLIKSWLLNINIEAKPFKTIS